MHHITLSKYSEIGKIHQGQKENLYKKQCENSVHFCKAVNFIVIGKKRYDDPGGVDINQKFEVQIFFIIDKYNNTIDQE